MQLPKSKKSRIWLALAAVGVIAIVAFGFTAYHLWQDGNAPSGSKADKDKYKIGDAPTGYPTFEGAPTPKAGADVLAAKGKVFSNVNPFATGYGDSRLHTVTLSVSGDGALSIGYRFRDGKSGDSKVVNRSFSTTRSVHGPLPVAQIGVQVLSNASYATCSITIDGTTTTSHKSRIGPGHVVVCTS